MRISRDKDNRLCAHTYSKPVIQRDFSVGNANIYLHNIFYEDNGNIVNDLPEDAVLELSKIKQVEYSPSSGGMSSSLYTYDIEFNVGIMCKENTFCTYFCIPGTYIHKKVTLRIKFSDYCIMESFINNALRNLLKYCRKTFKYQFKKDTIDETVNAFKYRHYYV